MNETYEQVSSCYEDISCCQLTHPVLIMTKKICSGSISEQHKCHEYSSEELKLVNEE